MRTPKRFVLKQIFKTFFSSFISHWSHDNITCHVASGKLYLTLIFKMRVWWWRKEFPSGLSGLMTQRYLLRVQVWSLASLSGLRIQCSHKLQHRSQTWLSLVLLWLWPWSAAAALILLLALQLPYATGETMKNKNERTYFSSIFLTFSQGYLSHPRSKLLPVPGILLLVAFWFSFPHQNIALPFIPTLPSHVHI